MRCFSKVTSLKTRNEQLQAHIISQQIFNNSKITCNMLQSTFFNLFNKLHHFIFIFSWFLTYTNKMHFLFHCCHRTSDIFASPFFHNGSQQEGFYPVLKATSLRLSFLTVFSSSNFCCFYLINRCNLSFSFTPFLFFRNALNNESSLMFDLFRLTNRLNSSTFLYTFFH